MRNYSSINESNHTVPTESTFHSLSNVSTIRVRTITKEKEKKTISYRFITMKVKVYVMFRREELR